MKFMCLLVSPLSDVGSLLRAKLDCATPAIWVGSNFLGFMFSYPIKTSSIVCFICKFHQYIDILNKNISNIMRVGWYIGHTQVLIFHWKQRIVVLLIHF